MPTIQVKRKDIDEGLAESCEACPVALATERVTKEDCRVQSVDGQLRLFVGARSIAAPEPVRRFVYYFDRLDAEEGEPVCGGYKPRVPRRLPPELQTFTFKIPPLSDAEWEEGCYGCERLYPTEELDDEGFCWKCSSVPDDPRFSKYVDSVQPQETA